MVSSNFKNHSRLRDINNWGLRLCDEETSDGLLIKDHVLIASRPSFTNVSVPSSVTAIGGWVFINYRNLESVKIANSVKSIGQYAFYNCISLKSIEIPSSVTSIGYSAFSGCSSLTSITIPNSVTSIGGGAFRHCYFSSSNFTNLSQVHDDGYWGATIFDEETKDGLLIDNKVVVKCRYWATSIVIPEYVTSIGDGAFSGCSSLTSITIPNSVTSIGEGAFYGYGNLTSVVSLIETPFAVAGKNSENPSFSFGNATLYVPSGTIDKYKATDGWKDFAHIVEGIPTAVGEVKAVSGQTAVYQLDGRKVTNMQHGINIVRDKTGATRKVMMR